MTRDSQDLETTIWSNGTFLTWLNYLFPMMPGEKQPGTEKLSGWIRYSLVFAFSLPCLFAIAVFYRYEGAWSMWLSLFFSRGIYFILATLIFVCFIINIFKNKFQSNTGSLEVRHESPWRHPGSSSLWKEPFLAGCNELTLRKPLSIEEVCGSEAAMQMLREADARNEALKRELEELNKARMSLEERSGKLEREKAQILEQLEEAKFQSGIESEGLRKEAAIAQRQLQQVIEERDMLSREVTSSSREARITDSALKDQARLTTRLEEARAELNKLKQHMEEMKMERDTAVAIAADLAVRAQGAADDSAQLIGQWVKREMESRKRMDNEASTIAIVAAEPQPPAKDSSEVNIQEDNIKNEKIEGKFHEARGSSNVIETDIEVPMISDGMKADSDTKILDMNMEGVTMINWEEDDECLQALGCGPVTSSAAFRDFLSANYSPLSM